MFQQETTLSSCFKMLEFDDTLRKHIFTISGKRTLDLINSRQIKMFTFQLMSYRIYSYSQTSKAVLSEESLLTNISDIEYHNNSYDKTVKLFEAY